MNVVGKVGSLISQGVYSVATPFHPFGGAVDVIVVQQQDGTFRSTPWYVRFGKFQGVLQGAEEIVQISINGTEADFHMYLDKSGKAFFLHEIESTKDGPMHEGSDDSGALNEVDQIGVKNIVDESRLEHSISDSGLYPIVHQLNPGLLERSGSDGNRRFYDLQDDQSSLEDSVEFSEFDSNRFGTVEDEQIRSSPDADSEVILVSVDGHLLTAPVSSSEQNTDSVRLCTPQFHLGPVEGEEDFNSGDDAWTTGYIDGCTSNSDQGKDRSGENENKDVGQQLKDDEANWEHPFMIAEGNPLPNISVDPQRQGDAEGATALIKEDDVFNSCLERLRLPDSIGMTGTSKQSSLLAVQRIEDNLSYPSPDVNSTRDGNQLKSKNAELSSSFSDTSENTAIEVGAEHLEGQSTKCTSNATTESFLPDSPELKFGDSITPIQTITEDETLEIQDDRNDLQETSDGITEGTSSKLDISLCGKEFFAGMGLDAAAKAFESHRVSLEEFKNSPISVTQDETLIARYEGMYFSWQQAAPLVLGMAAFGFSLPIKPENAIPVDEDTASASRDDEYVMNSAVASRRWRLWPNPFRRIKPLEHTDNTSSTEEYFVDTESVLSNSNIELNSSPQGNTESPKKQMLRTNVPTSDQIASLNLRDGQNLITFNFSTRVLGKQQVEAHLYLWKWNARIVISDVDGTITKSDVLGQFMPLVGKDWSQSGVAKLFSAIKENGYQLLFLSARAIVQAYLTRSFLFNLKQDGKTLPNGPVVISPDGLFPSLYREVIRRAPHEFKIACLEDIRRLFPSDYNPFYAGFGNRDTDELSYRKIGIPKGKVFIINPKGEVAVSHCIDVKSYTSLHTLVNDMFPPTSLVEQEDYNAWNFWKVPLPDIEM